MAKKTWRELEAEGVRRCCVMFTNGRRCRRRAVSSDAFQGNWCAKHGPIMKAHTDQALAAINEQRRRDDHEEN
jgi:hypothetical protein